MAQVLAAAILCLTVFLQREAVAAAAATLLPAVVAALAEMVARGQHLGGRQGPVV